MLIVVDDEEVLRDSVQQTLEQAGYEVTSLSNAKDALEVAEVQPPEAIISDVMMPVMDGLEFHKEYRRRFPERNTPFVFMSSLDEDTSIVTALDGGAEDYLVKPVSSPVLISKIRAILRRTKQHNAATFVGDLSKLNFSEILKFCELKGLNGVLQIDSEGVVTQVEFIAGSIQLEDADMGLIDKLFDLEQGRFVIYSQVVDFGAIRESKVQDIENADQSDSDAQVVTSLPGRLSAVRVSDKTFQIQTEVLSYPTPSIISIVTVDGRLVTKRRSETEPSADQSSIALLITTQHAKLEDEVKNRLNQLPEQENTEEDGTRVRYHKLLDEGFERYRERDFEGAMEVWLEAQKLHPESKTLRVNMAVVKAKIEKAQNTW